MSRAIWCLDLSTRLFDWRECLVAMSPATSKLISYHGHGWRGLFLAATSIGLALHRAEGDAQGIHLEISVAFGLQVRDPRRALEFVRRLAFEIWGQGLRSSPEASSEAQKFSLAYSGCATPMPRHPPRQGRSEAGAGPTRGRVASSHPRAAPRRASRSSSCGALPGHCLRSSISLRQPY